MMDMTMTKKTGRPDELKQVWMKDDDFENFQRVAKLLESDGIDVRHGGEFSLTKVVRHVLKNYGKRPKK